MKKNADQVAQFRCTFATCLRTHIPATNTKPVRVFAYDESRFGLHTVRRRRLTAKGVKPIGIMQYDFQAFYLFGAIAPTTGRTFF